MEWIRTILVFLGLSYAITFQIGVLIGVILAIKDNRR